MSSHPISSFVCEPQIPAHPGALRQNTAVTAQRPLGTWTTAQQQRITSAGILRGVPLILTMPSTAGTMVSVYFKLQTQTVWNYWRMENDLANSPTAPSVSQKRFLSLWSKSSQSIVRHTENHTWDAKHPTQKEKQESQMNPFSKEKDFFHAVFITQSPRAIGSTVLGQGRHAHALPRYYCNTPVLSGVVPLSVSDRYLSAYSTCWSDSFVRFWSHDKNQKL